MRSEEESSKDRIDESKEIQQTAISSTEKLPDAPEDSHIVHNPQFAIYWHPNCAKHYIPDHPEEPGRVKSILEKLRKHFPEEAFRKCNSAKDEQVLLFHDASVVSQVKKLANSSNQHFQQKHEEKYCRIDMDTVIMHHSKDSIYYATGSILTAIDHVYDPALDASQRIHTAYCVARPPGHHASPGISTGFCFFNNIGVGAKYALAKYNVARLAILDIDVHHGNGTEDGFQNDERVFYGSTHEKEGYPGTGLDPSPLIGDKAQLPLHRRIVNRYIHCGSESRREFREKWLEILPEMIRFQPELILISAGFDAHDDDELSDVELNDEDYRWITQEILLAGLECNPTNPPPCLSILEGGYHLHAIARSSLLHCRVLNDGYESLRPQYEERIKRQEEAAQEQALLAAAQEKALVEGHEGNEVAALQDFLEEIGLK